MTNISRKLDRYHHQYKETIARQLLVMFLNLSPNSAIGAGKGKLSEENSVLQSSILDITALSMVFMVPISCVSYASLALSKLSRAVPYVSSQTSRTEANSGGVPGKWAIFFAARSAAFAISSVALMDAPRTEFSDTLLFFEFTRSGLTVLMQREG